MLGTAVACVPPAAFGLTFTLTVLVLLPVGVADGYVVMGSGGSVKSSKMENLLRFVTLYNEFRVYCDRGHEFSPTDSGHTPPDDRSSDPSAALAVPDVALARPHRPPASSIASPHCLDC